MPSITIVAVDDHFLIREGIKSLINNEIGMELVGEGSCGSDVLPLIIEHHPNILILDINMPHTNNPLVEDKFNFIPTLQAIQQRFPQMGVIILSQIISHVLIEGMISLGVKAYLLKQDELAKNLMQAVRAVNQGGLFFSDTIAKKMLDSTRTNSHKGILTRRQKEFIVAISQDPDSSYGQHAKNFNITEQSLKNQLHMAFRKLEVKNVTSAIIKSIKLGIIEIDSEVS